MTARTPTTSGQEQPWIHSRPPLREQAAVWSYNVLWPQLKQLGRLPRQRIVTQLIFVIIGLVLAAAVFKLSAWFLQLCYAVEVVGPLICQRLLEIVLLVLLSVLLLSNIVTALSHFYLATDLELLLAAPIPPRSFFGARFLQQILHSSWMVLAFGLPVLLAFAQVAGTPYSLLAIVIVLPPLLVFPAAAGVSLTLLLGVLLPAARLRNLVVGLFFLAFLVLYVVLRLMEPERLLNPEGFASVVYLLSSLTSPSASYLPSHWAAEVITATFSKSVALVSWPTKLAALITGAGAAYVISSIIFRRGHALAFARSQEASAVALLSRLWSWLVRRPLPRQGAMHNPGHHAPSLDWIRWLATVLPRGPYREMVIKDAKLLLRDASQWSQLVLLLALIFVYLYNFNHFRNIGDAGLVSHLALYLLGMGLCGFVTTAVSVRFAFPLISLEGRLMWLLRVSPVPPRQILLSKLLSTLPLLVVVAEVMAITSALILGVSSPLIVLSGILGGLNALAVGSLSVGVGALLPDYRAESAAKIATSFGSLVCMTLAMIVALAQVAFAIYPAYILYQGIPFSWLKLGLYLAGGIGITVLAIMLPLWLGIRSLEKNQL